VTADVLGNMTFSRNLTNWFTANGIDWYPHPQNPGTADWSEEYDGSAKLVVSGSPGSVHLLQATRTMLSAGDKLVVGLVAENMVHATLVVAIGTADYGGQYAQLVEPEDGEHQLVLDLNGHWQPGTMVMVALVCWPGNNATCYVTNIRQVRGNEPQQAE
jgi:hypothetical protein